jgi:hypothetical protein
LVLIVLAAAAAAGGVFLLRPDLVGDSAPAGSDQTDPVAAQPATSSAPYTIQAEPSEVATDAPVPTTGGHVQVVLTYVTFDTASGAVQGNGFAAGVIEDGGTCTLTLSRHGDTVRTKTTAVADAATSTCGLLETRTGLEAGTWEAVLSYSSDRAQGESEAVKVVVP